MSYPDQINKAILEILQTACLSIRAAGWKDDTRYCALEADHVHNMPSLLLKPNLEGLKYYLEVSRADYLKQIKEMDSGRQPLGCESQWRILEEYANQS